MKHIKQWLNNHPKIKIGLISLCFIAVLNTCGNLEFILGAESAGYNCTTNADGVVVCNK